MALATAAVALLMAQAPAQAIDSVDVAVEELEANRNEAAISRIEANTALDANDPARLINLGIAHAREGDAAKARAMFEAASDGDRLQLETADGNWVDSRNLARRALAMLERGEFRTQSRTAMR